MKANIKCGNALAKGFSASLVDSLKGEATVWSLGTCVCRSNGVEVSTGDEHKEIRASGISRCFPRRSSGTSIGRMYSHGD